VLEHATKAEKNMAKKRVADVLVDTVVAAGVKHVYGLVGDSLNGVTDSIRPRKDLQWVAACSVIVTNTFRIVKGSVYDVTDPAASPLLRDPICAAAANQPGVQRIEKCLVRKSGTNLFVELHVEVDPSVTIREGHRIGHQVKAALIAANPRIQDVIVHLEPAGGTLAAVSNSIHDPGQKS
jgi:Dimerisation domain of Zinc Transporter